MIHNRQSNTLQMRPQISPFFVTGNDTLYAMLNSMISLQILPQFNNSDFFITIIKQELRFVLTIAL